MVTTSVALHLEHGIRIETEVEVPADLDDDEVLESLQQQIGERQPTPTRVVGGVLFHIGAFRAIELL